MAQVHDLQDAFNFIEGIVDDLKREVAELEAKTTELREEVDSLESEAYMSNLEDRSEGSR